MKSWLSSRRNDFHVLTKGGGNGRGGQSGVDWDKHNCTHFGRNRHTHKTCWGFMSIPYYTSAYPIMCNKPNNTGNQEKYVDKDEPQNLKDEVTILCKRLQALEGGNPSCSASIVSYP